MKVITKVDALKKEIRSLKKELREVRGERNELNLMYYRQRHWINKTFENVIDCLRGDLHLNRVTFIKDAKDVLVSTRLG